jgi:membrane protein implicated in regulation of membrane protease activity
MFGLWEWVYLGCFLFGLGYLLLLVVTGQVGGDTDGGLDLADDFDVQVEAEGGGDAAHDLSFFTPLVIASLLAGVGGAGLFASLTLGLPWIFHLPIAALGGWAVGYLAYLLYKKVLIPMQGSSEVRVEELWGTVAEVTTPIPENRTGEVRFIAAGSYVSAPARSVTGESLARGQVVMIEKIENSVALVRPTQ